MPNLKEKQYFFVKNVKNSKEKHVSMRISITSAATDLKNWLIQIHLHKWQHPAKNIANLLNMLS